MITRRSDGTYDAGPMDIMCILKMDDGNLHAALFEQLPKDQYPTEVQCHINAIKQDWGEDCSDLVVLKRKLHHTQGAETISEARVHLRNLRKKIILPSEQVVDDISMDFDKDILILTNWKILDKPLLDVIEWVFAEAGIDEM